MVTISRSRSRDVRSGRAGDIDAPESEVVIVATGDPTLGSMTDIADVAPHILDEIEHFFRVYKQLEPRAHVETSGWHGADAACTLVADCTDAYRRLDETPDDRSPL